jgi:hypothetical protein
VYGVGLWVDFSYMCSNTFITYTHSDWYIKTLHMAEKTELGLKPGGRNDGVSYGRQRFVICFLTKIDSCCTFGISKYIFFRKFLSKM